MRYTAHVIVLVLCLLCAAWLEGTKPLPQEDSPMWNCEIHGNGICGAEIVQ